MQCSAMPRRLESGRMTAFSEKLVRSSELFVVGAAGLLVIAAVVLATVVLYGLFIDSFHAHLGTVSTIEAVQTGVQNVFAGVLLLMLGLELLETLKTYFKDYHIRTEVILVVAIIAVGRHVIQTDFEHTSGSILVGMAALMVALAVSYYLVRLHGPRSLNGGPVARAANGEGDQASKEG